MDWLGRCRGASLPAVFSISRRQRSRNGGGRVVGVALAQRLVCLYRVDIGVCPESHQFAGGIAGHSADPSAVRVVFAPRAANGGCAVRIGAVATSAQFARFVQRTRAPFLTPSKGGQGFHRPTGLHADGGAFVLSGEQALATGVGNHGTVIGAETRARIKHLTA